MSNWLKAIDDSALIITAEGRVYHLDLLPEEIADTILLVGDPARVHLLASYLDKIEVQRVHREFHTLTGYYRDLRLTVVSTGIGTDNIDIVVNELDALANIDFGTRQRKEQLRSLRLIRLGTCGALHEMATVGCLIFSDYALGLDNLLYYYADYARVVDLELTTKLLAALNWQIPQVNPYLVAAAAEVRKQFQQQGIVHGLTLTAPGFYGPQLRELRLASGLKFLEQGGFRHNLPELPPIVNFEMEISALYGLAGLLGHAAGALCVAVANRYAGSFAENPELAINQLLSTALTSLAARN